MLFYEGGKNLSQLDRDCVAYVIPAMPLGSLSKHFIFIVGITVPKFPDLPYWKEFEEAC